jgi:DNA repair exonuclease SbcCD nuclease subunit
MSILFIGDPHIKTDNIPESDLLINKILEIIEKEKPNICIIAGDVMHYHEKLYTVALNKSHEMILKISEKIPTYVLVGNHDMINNQQFLTDNHWMNSMKYWKNDVTIVDKPIHLELEDKNFVMCPYVYPGRFIEALATLSTFDWKESDLIFAHQEFKGCKMGAITSELGDFWELENPKVVSGHIHNNQTPQENVYYPGASQQQAFGESERCVLAKIDLGTLEIKELELDLPRKKIISLDISKIDDFKIKETDDKIRLTITGDYDEFKSFKKTEKFKKINDSGIKVVFKHKKSKKDKEMEKLPELKDITDFNNILDNIINRSKNINLIKAYELIVNNKKIKEDDILFL